MAKIRTMEQENKGKINKKLFADRKRTNILSNPEQRLITYLVPRIPNWLSSDGLTFIGLIGSLLITASFLLAKYVHVSFLLFGIVSFFIQWFGDSLDGRIAFYRNKSRKWYGFALDIIVDWISTVFIGLGYVFYTEGIFELSGFVLVAFYGWAMIVSQLRYKITGEYHIDSGPVGPTEIRVIISIMLLMEVLFPGVLDYLVFALCLVLLVNNLLDTAKLLKQGDERDHQEKAAKQKSTNTY